MILLLFIQTIIIDLCTPLRLLIPCTYRNEVFNQTESRTEDKGNGSKGFTSQISNRTVQDSRKISYNSRLVFLSLPVVFLLFLVSIFDFVGTVAEIHQLELERLKLLFASTTEGGPDASSISKRAEERFQGTEGRKTKTVT